MSDSFASTAPSQPSNPITSRSSPTVKPEPVRVDTTIKVVIKSENEPDLIEQVTFVKGEDGKFDVWNLEHLGLGPPIVVEERFCIGFRRSVISDVSSGVPYLSNQANLTSGFGGGHQTTSNSWKGRTKTDKFP